MCLPGKILPTVSIESKNENAGVPGGNSSSMISFELPVIIDKIKTLLIEGVLPGNIAVIYHNKDTGKLILQYFEAESITMFSTGDIGLEQKGFNRKVIKIMKFLAEEKEMRYSGDHHLFEILHFDVYKIPPIEIVNIAVEVNRRLYSKDPVS